MAPKPLILSRLRGKNNSDNMSGHLIPLRLSASLEIKKETSSLNASSSSVLSSPIASSASYTLSTYIPLQPEKQLRRRPGPVTDLILFPYTPEEWNIVMQEVKKLYHNGQYKQCAARCTLLLENVKNTYRVHPLYSIYLSFYAASCLEVTARALHVNSSNKLPLFQQALQYYNNAESFMEFASFSADPKIIQAAAARRSSILSSVRSSTDSVFSNNRSSTSSASSSALPSPTNSICTPLPGQLSYIGNQFSRPELAPVPLRIKKIVSFDFERPSLTLPSASTASESDSNLENSELLNHFPSPPLSPSPSSSSFPQNDDIASFLLSRSLARYRRHLTDLHSQLNYHIASVSAQMRFLRSQRRARRSNQPTLFAELGSRGIEGVDKDEIRKVELTARIARMREKGWERKRFDGERYKILCERALVELD